jgi:hypothetical protein
MLGPSHPDTNECTVMQTVFLEDDARSRKTVDCDAKTTACDPRVVGWPRRRMGGATNGG